MTSVALEKCQHIAEQVTTALGGWGLFGVEFFIKGDAVYFSEVSPRPHDTGMVTMISQDLSEFALRAGHFGFAGAQYSHPWRGCFLSDLAHGRSQTLSYMGAAAALAQPDTQLRLFGKPEVDGERRVGVALALADNIEQARSKASAVAAGIRVHYDNP